MLTFCWTLLSIESAHWQCPQFYLNANEKLKWKSRFNQFDDFPKLPKRNCQWKQFEGFQLRDAKYFPRND